MKLQEMKPLKEYWISPLSKLSTDVRDSILKGSTQNKYHIIVKDDDERVLFVWSKIIDGVSFAYSLRDHKTGDTVGYAMFNKIDSKHGLILQEVGTFINPDLRGNTLAARLYAYISHINKCTIINGLSLSKEMEHVWLKFKERKIYDRETDTFYELNDDKAQKPENDNDKLDPSGQRWFYAYAEVANLSEYVRYLGEKFDYDRFLAGLPGYKMGSEYVGIVPMTPYLF